jgi:hypothetical protein
MVAADRASARDILNRDTLATDILNRAGKVYGNHKLDTLSNITRVGGILYTVKINTGTCGTEMYYRINLFVIIFRMDL